MNTSAQDTPASAEYTGRLVAPAQCRMRQVDRDGHVVPVLVLDLELDTVLRTRMRAEQPFPADQAEACQAAARRHRVGEHVSVQGPLADVALVARQIQHVHVLPPTPTTTTEEAVRP